MRKMANALLIPSALSASEDNTKNVAYGAGYYFPIVQEAVAGDHPNINLDYSSNPICKLNGTLTHASTGASINATTEDIEFYTGWFGIFMPHQLNFQLASSAVGGPWSVSEPSTILHLYVPAFIGPPNNPRSTLMSLEWAINTSYTLTVTVNFLIETEISPSGIHVIVRYKDHTLSKSGTATFSVGFHPIVNLTATIMPWDPQGT
jgi:hypothetical protein